MKMKEVSIKLKNNRGFTLIELLISMTIFLVAIAAIFGIARFASVQKNTVNTRTDQLRSARIALEYIRRDAINAGFGYHRTGGNMPDNAGNSLFKTISDSDTQRDLLTSIIAGNDITTNILNLSGKMDVIGFVSRDTTFNNGSLVNYTGSTASGTSVNVTTSTNISTICNVYDLYLLESSAGTTQVVGLVTSKPNNTTIQFATGSSDPLGLNQSATATGDNQNLLVTTAGGGTIKKISLVSYYITSDGVLIRKTFGNQTGLPASSQIESRELVYGVSDFQIKYFMEDGTTLDDPTNGNNGRLNQIKMNNVVQVQVSITLESDTSGLPQASAPLTIREFISTKNLRYEAS